MEPLPPISEIEPLFCTGTVEERLRAFDEWIGGIRERHRDTPTLPDWAMTREYIYED